METGPRFKVSSERPEKREMDFAIPGLVVQRVIYYITAEKMAMAMPSLSLVLYYSS